MECRVLASRVRLPISAEEQAHRLNCSNLRDNGHSVEPVPTTGLAEWQPKNEKATFQVAFQTADDPPIFRGFVFLFGNQG